MRQMVIGPQRLRRCLPAAFARGARALSSGTSRLAPRVPPERRVVLHNCVLWTGERATAAGSGDARPAFAGTVVLRGNRIEQVIAGTEHEAAGPADAHIDCKGLSVIPGLVEGHAHPSFEDLMQTTDAGDVPPEEGILYTVQNCERLLRAGFTSAFSAAAVRIRQDVVARNWINQGRARGPRLLAASPEICPTGNLGDSSALHQHRDSFGLVADGADQVRRAVRLCLREGVDTVKINIGGDLVPCNMLTEARDDILSAYGEAEVQAACEVTHSRERRVAAHCRGSNDVRLALKYGVDVIYHCDFAWKDEGILDAMEAAKDRIFVGPAVGLMHGLAPEIPDVQLLLDAQCKTYTELRKRGLRVVIGGDYGFRVTPQGTNANDLMHFQNYFGYTAEEALVSATRIGGELMRLDVGQLRAGWLADLLIVEGKPWLQSAPLLATGSGDAVCTPGIKAIVQDGDFVRNEL
eukprot:Hpha_TRINITY_DN17732_c0_g1::TRINITY_DN17732_c0_g1_i1::g.46322::m.46322